MADLPRTRRRESVWDYPRPPALEPDDRHVVVEFAGVVVADTRAAFRVLETSHPPVFYIPRADVATELLRPSPRRTRCEWKGTAAYWTLVVGRHVAAEAAWSYPEPTPAFRPITGHLAFYPARMGRCTVGDETVRAQPGDFYGGWITSEITGPFKGGPGSAGW